MVRPLSGEIDSIQFTLVKSKVPAIQKRVVIAVEGPSVQPDQKLAPAAQSAFRPELTASYAMASPSSGATSPVTTGIAGDPLMALQRVRQAQSQEHEQAIKNQVGVQTKAVEDMAKLRRCMEEFERMKGEWNDFNEHEARKLGTLMRDAGILDGEDMMNRLINDPGNWEVHEGTKFIRVKAGEHDNKEKAEKGNLIVLKAIEQKLNFAMDNIKDQQRLNDHKSSTLAKQFTNAEESALNLQNMGHKLLDIVTSKTFQP